MRIDDTAFADITIDGKTYNHDMVIRFSGDAVKRKKKLPSFFRLAGQRKWDARSMARALGHSHDMVPVALPDVERDRLAAYINSFR